MKWIWLYASTFFETDLKWEKWNGFSSLWPLLDLQKDLKFGLTCRHPIIINK